MKQSHETVTIIPARGGSKGLPGKNLRVLGGKPLIAYAIEAARGSRHTERVIVSTDDAAIGEVAIERGAEVVWRPDELSGDTAASESALLHTLDHLRTTEGYTPEFTLFLQCTSPLTLPSDIDGTFQALLDAAADTALSVTPFHYFLWRPDQVTGAIGINHDKQVRPLRQEREDQFLETGAVYLMRTQGFLEARHRFFGRTVMYVMPQERCLEIDSITDFESAEVCLRERRRQECLDLLPSPAGALVLDFDGVMTDNRVLVLEDGSEGVFCDRADGMGLEWLRRAGVAILVLSKEQNPVVKARCRKLGIPCLQGIDEKAAALIEWIQSNGLDAASTVYVGNDVNDVQCMRLVGCAVAVADARAEAKAAAHLVLETAGGHGAVREIAELILNNMGVPTDGQLR